MIYPENFRIEIGIKYLHRNPTIYILITAAKIILRYCEKQFAAEKAFCIYFHASLNASFSWISWKYKSLFGTFRFCHRISHRMICDSTFQHSLYYSSLFPSSLAFHCVSKFSFLWLVLPAKKVSWIENIYPNNYLNFRAFFQFSLFSC